MKNNNLIGYGLLGVGLIGLGALAAYLFSNQEEDPETSTEPTNKVPNKQPKKDSPSLAANEIQELVKQSNSTQVYEREQPKKNERTTTDPNQKQQKTSKAILTPVKAHKKEVDATASVDTETIKFPPAKADEFPLRLGSKGERVERLQIWLMKNYGHFGLITNSFDERLENLVVKRFKKPFVSQQDYESRRMGQSVQKQPSVG